MKNTLYLFFIACSIWVSPLYGQTNFRDGLEKSDPIPKDSPLVFEEKLKIHQAFLDQAIQEKDELNQLYGMLYIFIDHIEADDFVEARQYLLEAEKIAEESGNPGWQGWVSYRAGILYVRMSKEEQAIATYEKAVPLCEVAGDSLCLGESLEQLSAIHSLLGNHEVGHQYFERAMPLLEKYGTEKIVATALQNFGGLLLMQGQPAEGISYLERAIALQNKLEQYRAVAKGMNNLAVAYRRMGQVEKAIEMYHKCIEFNTEHGFEENMITNYMGLFIAYEAKGDFPTAIDFLFKRFDLRDSLMGIKTKEKIAELEVKYESNQKELKLQKKQVQLAESQQRLERGGMLFLFVLLSGVLGLWRWRKQSRQAKQQLAENQKNLMRLTRVLLDKNRQLTVMEEKISELQIPNDPTNRQEQITENLYNQRILTKSDWMEFKTFFEKTYPGYLFRLRSSFPTLSEAEERLFLFIKLKLTREEVATILGISSDSVKRTRNRLRKRLGLDQEVPLDSYIQKFNGRRLSISQ